MTRLALGGGLTLLTMSVASTAAGQLQAGPTLLEIGPDGAATRLTLANTGSSPIAAQVRVYAWSQPGGVDQLVPSDQLVVSPPIAELPPGGEQVVRVVRLGPPASDLDQTYRIVVDELPSDETSSDSVVKIRLRYVLPVFVRAADADPPSVSCIIPAAGTELRCENTGGRAAQLGASRLVDESGHEQSLSDGLFGYVLPASERVWPLFAASPPLGRSGLRLETRLNGEQTIIPVDRTP